jgi:hypothetical protein
MGGLCCGWLVVGDMVVGGICRKEGMAHGWRLARAGLYFVLVLDRRGCQQLDSGSLGAASSKSKGKTRAQGAVGRWCCVLVLARARTKGQSLPPTAPFGTDPKLRRPDWRVLALTSNQLSLRAQCSLSCLAPAGP